MSAITVVAGEPPYGKERTLQHSAFRSRRSGRRPPSEFFLFEDALFAAEKGQSPHEFPGVLDQHMPNCEALLQGVVRQGAKVKLSDVCASERRVGPGDLSIGEIIGMRDLVQWVLESDRTVGF